MNRSITLIISFLILQTTSVFGKTEYISGNETLTKENSPYENITYEISENGSLTIEPGVELINVSIYITGSLLVNGTESENITINSSYIRFRNTNLSNSIFEFTNFTSTEIEPRHYYGSEYNNPLSGILKINNSSFDENSTIFTDSYNVNVPVQLNDCNLNNSLIWGRGQEIQCINTNITNSTIFSESENYGGIYLENSIISNSEIKAGQELANLKFINCEIDNSDFITSGAYSEIIIDNSEITNTTFDSLLGSLEITDSQLYNPKGSPEYQLSAANISLTNSTFQLESGLEGIDAILIKKSSNNVIENCTFIGYQNAITISKSTSVSSFNNNNFLNIKDNYIINNSTYDIYAQYNYWNTINEELISAKIYDYIDDKTKGLVYYDNFLNSSTSTEGISIPINLYKAIQSEYTILNWESNPELNIAGYKLYKIVNSNELIFLADVGNTTSYSTDAVSIDDDIVITAYTTDADGTNDMIEGNESGYSEYAKYYITTELNSSDSICSEDNIELTLSFNYDFDDNETYVFQLSDIQNSFENPILEESFHTQEESISINLPAATTFSGTYYFRINALNENVSSAISKISVFDKKDLLLEIEPINCYSDTIILSANYKLLQDTTLNYGDSILMGNLDDGYIIDVYNDSTIKLFWPTVGEKEINLSLNNFSCSVDTTFSINVLSRPTTPEICMVTVDEETSKNMLVWSYDMESVEKFGIYRETNAADEYSLIEYVEANSFNTYIDQQSAPAQAANRYKISAVDSCGTETQLSDYHKTIHLTINKGLNNDWNLIWTGYEGFSFSTYRIYRGSTDDDLELLTEITSSATSYTDTEAPSRGNINYQIEVLNPNDCSDTPNGRVKDYSSIKSNIARYGAVTAIDDAIENMDIYPNPTQDKVLINFQSVPNGSYSIQTISGKLIEQGVLKQQMQINLKDQADGMYLLIFKTENGSSSKKIFKGE